MKTMTCRQFGGPCDKEFHANTFEEMMEKSKKHGMEMFQNGDKEHTRVMNEMKAKMKTQTSEDMKDWLEKKRELFMTIPEDE